MGITWCCGDPQGFYKLPEEDQVDMLAFREVLLDRDSDLRYELVHPPVAYDAIRMGIKEGRLKVRNTSFADMNKEDRIKAQMSSPSAGARQLRAELIHDGATPEEAEMVISGMRDSR